MSEALKAAVDPLILALLERQPDYGYSLLTRLRGQYGLKISDGSLYPALYRLEQSGKIEGVWHTSDVGRRRKVFSLTVKGRNSLKKTRIEWPKLVRVFDRAFGPVPAEGQ